MNIVILVTTFVIMAGGAVPGISPRVAAPPESPAPLIHALPVEPLYDGAGNIIQPGATVEDLDQAKWSYIISQLEKFKAEEEAATARARKVWQIDDYLAGSPMAGLGTYIVERCEAYSINPYLVPAIAEAESSCGRACFAAHNAWGMIGAGGFGSWQSAIDYWCEMVNTHWPGAQTSFQMRGYCVPDSPWDVHVDGVARAISQREGFGGGGSSAE